MDAESAFIRDNLRLIANIIMRVIIFVNGQLTEPERLRSLIHADDYIIAVNGGTRHALTLGVTPDMIIGDLDSLNTVEQAQVEAQGTKILRFPSRKDETDLELALRHAADRQAAEILIFTALGGRVDQSVANILLLTLPELMGREVRIIEGNQTAFVIQHHAEIPGTPGDTVSILPIGGDAVGVSNDGFEWPLHEETLPFGITRGISNVLVKPQGSIRVQQGMLLCVVTHAA